MKIWTKNSQCLEQRFVEKKSKSIYMLFKNVIKLPVLFCFLIFSGCSYLVKDYYKASFIEIPKVNENISSAGRVRLQDLSVGVDRSDSGSSEELIDILQKTHLFAKVDFLENFKKDPDLILTYPRDKFEDILVEVAQVFSQMVDRTPGYGSFGILHSRARSYEYNLEFNLASGTEKKSVLIPLKVKLMRVTGGWPFMTPLVLFQQWYLDENKALSRVFKRAILKQQKEILAIVP